MNAAVARRSYPMSQCRLYKVASPADLASRLGVSVKALEALAVDEGNYKIFPIEQKGKTRMVQAPKPPLQKLHARIHIFLSRIETPDYLHSAIKGRSYLSNAQAHLNDGSLIKVDVKKFFQSVPKVAVYKFFREHLRCAEQDLKMTCYVDDLAISGSRASPKLLHEVRQIIGRNGLKSHKVKYFAARRPKIVTGVVINKGQAHLPNKRHLLIKQGYTSLQEATTPEAKIDILKGLTSRVHEAAQIDAATWLPKARALQLLRKELMKKVS